MGDLLVRDGSFYMIDVVFTVVAVGLMMTIVALFKGKKRGIIHENGRPNLTTGNGAVEHEVESKGASTTEISAVAKWTPFLVLNLYLFSFVFYVVSAFKSLDAREQFFFRCGSYSCTLQHDFDTTPARLTAAFAIPPPFKLYQRSCQSSDPLPTGRSLIL